MEKLIPPRPRLIVVLGMHRTGTSVLARALAALGAHLGDALIEPAHDNETGFWEDRDLLGINIELLDRLRMGWDRVLPDRTGDLFAHNLSDLADRALGLLEAKLVPDAPFVFKDPRTARLLPFWVTVFRRLGRGVAYAVSCRQPLAVSRSLAKRNAIPPETSHLLWLDHVASALLHTREEPCVVVDYDRMLDDPHGQLGRIAERLGLAYAPTAPGVLSFVEDFLAERLRHARYEWEDLTRDRTVPTPIVSLYSHLLAMAQDRPQPQQDIPAYESALRWLGRDHDVFSGRIDWLTRHQERRDAAHSATVAALDAQLRGLTATLAERDGTIVALRADRARSDRNHATRFERLEMALTRLEGDHAAHIRRLENELAQAKAATEHLAARQARQIETVHTELAESRNAAARADADMRTFMAQRAEQTDETIAVLAQIATDTTGVLSMGRRLLGLGKAALLGTFRKRLREDGDIAAIGRTGVFDAPYYLKCYPDVAAAGADPLHHYVRHGAREGRDPHPDFQTRAYLSAHADVSAHGVNPLAHYVRHGAAEGRSLSIRWKDPSGRLNPLLARRLFKAPTLESAPPSVLPEGRFSWLTPADRARLETLLDHYGLTTISPSPRTDHGTARSRLAAVLDRLPDGPPMLSIVIPVHNQIRHTLACLESLALWPSRHPIEILIGDDASTDGTDAVLSGLTHVTVVRHRAAGGFLENCNRTAAQASGRYLLLLNNDTVVLPGMLDALLQTFVDHPQCGLAGCKLLYPDGTLQEAGGIIWADGTGWNFGRGDDPMRPRYGYLREVDYCSGAAIALPLALWRDLGGFDPLFRPAYYEDTDLSYRIRAMGRKVLYQPEAALIHFEGVSNGTSEDGGVKRSQRENRPKFADRWAAAIKWNGTAEDHAWNFAERTRRYRLLALDSTILTPDRDSGSMDTFILLHLFRQLGWHVSFVTEDLLDGGDATAHLRRMGIACHHRPDVAGFEAAIESLAPDADAILVSRQPVAQRAIPAIRRAAPKAKIIFNTIDLHFLRAMREAQFYRDDAMAERAEEIRRAELASIRDADATLVVSAHERELLRSLAPKACVWEMPVRRDVPSAPSIGFSQRDGVMFVGGFRHPPNQDAVKWLLDDIWPRTRCLGLKAPLFIVGADAPAFLADDPALDVHVLGHVPELGGVFDRCRVSVAPIRYGAGLKGKVIDSLLHRLPVVATPMATEGAGLIHDRHVLTADTAEGIAQAIVRLHQDQSLWSRLSGEGSNYARERFSAQAAETILADVLSSLGLPPIRL